MADEDATMTPWTETRAAASAPAATILIRLMVGLVFLPFSLDARRRRW